MFAKYDEVYCPVDFPLTIKGKDYAIPKGTLLFIDRIDVAVGTFRAIEPELYSMASEFQKAYNHLRLSDFRKMPRMTSNDSIKYITESMRAHYYSDCQRSLQEKGQAWTREYLTLVGRLRYCQLIMQSIRNKYAVE